MTIVHRVLSLWACCIALVGSAACHPEETIVHVAPTDAANEARIAAEIRRTYQNPHLELTRRSESHFAVRMYRATGDTSGLTSIAHDASVGIDKFLELVENLDSPAYIDRVTRASLAARSERTEVHRRRRSMFSNRKPFLFHLRVLFATRKIHEYGLHQGALRKPYEQAFEYLRRVDFRSFLLDPDVISVYAPQSTNCVYWLKQMNVIDLERDYTTAFQSIVMAEDDERSERFDYQNKLYGMTHFIIADSHYYQRLVSEQKYCWILDYFDTNIAQILSWAKPDVVAEVGLCFRLCGLHDHRVVGLVKERLAQAFDEDHGIIPSAVSEVDFDSSEHRNAVAYLVFFPWEELREGPWLDDRMVGLR